MSKFFRKARAIINSAVLRLKNAYAKFSPCPPQFSLDAKHFLDASDEMVDFMWGEGKEAIAELERSYRLNKENSNKLLNLLLAGVGGAALMFINSLQQSHFYLGLIIVVVGWAGCSLLLIKTCIESSKRVLGGRSPEDVYVDDPDAAGQKLTLPSAKRYILVNISKAIQALEFNVGRIARNLDCIRRLSAYVAVAAILVESIHLVFLGA